MTQAQKSRPSDQTKAAKTSDKTNTTSITDSLPTSVYDVVASLDRLATALADEDRAFKEGFKAGYADGYAVGHTHGERVADEIWSWALGAIGIGKRKATPDDRERLMDGRGPAALDQEDGQ